MKKTALFIILPALLFVTGCTSTQPWQLNKPEPIPGKYALQLLHIEVPMREAATSDPIEELLKNPEAVIAEFPIVYAAVGETAVHDPTGARQVTYADKTIPLGRFIEFTVIKIENGEIAARIVARETELSGMQPVYGDDGTLTTSMPLFRKFEIATEVTGIPDTWISLGDIPHDTPRTRRVVSVRFLSPSKN